MMVQVPTGEANKVGVFYCTVDSFGADGTAMMTTQAIEIMDVLIFLQGFRWKFTNAAMLGVGCSKLSCDECKVPGLLICS
jgi:hypothetical protein